MRTRWIPAASEERVYPDANLTVYTYALANGKPAAVAYYGKRSSSLWHHAFRSGEQREEFIAKAVCDLAASVTFRRTQREEKHAAMAEYVHPLEVGAVLVYQWGYEQTNTDFFEVTARTAKTVTMRPIAGRLTSEGGTAMSGNETPLPGRFLANAKPQTKRVRLDTLDGSPCLSMPYGVAVPWDGRPAYTSWYG